MERCARSEPCDTSGLTVSFSIPGEDGNVSEEDWEEEGQTAKYSFALSAPQYDEHFREFEDPEVAGSVLEGHPSVAPQPNCDQESQAVDISSSAFLPYQIPWDPLNRSISLGIWIILWGRICQIGFRSQIIGWWLGWNPT